MAKLRDIRNVAYANATDMANKVKKAYKATKRMCKLIINLLKLAIKTVWNMCKLVVFALSHITVTLVAITILICVYGVVTVIVADQLQFCLNPDDMRDGNSDLTDVDDPSLVYLAMAEALDRDKIAEYYSKNKDGFQQWYANHAITNLPNERPAKMIDLFLLVNEIYSRPEINNDSYTFPVNMPNVLGSLKLESSPSVLAFGDGERLFESEIEYYCNSSGYADPLGCPPGIWSSNLEISGYSNIGCTYICEDEYPALASEQRAIYGGGGNVSAGNARYITADHLSRRDSQKSMSTSDDSYKYLNTIRLKNSVMTHRGFTTWIPDALYNFAYCDRISTEGRNRDTHNYSSSYYDSGNKAAVEELQSMLDLTREQCGAILSMLYCGDRHYHCSVDALPNFEGIDKLQDDTSSICAAVTIILYLEGYLDTIVEECNKDLSVFYNNYVITEKIYGPYSLTGSYPHITSLDPDAAYMKCLKALESGSTNYEYPKEWITAYKKMQNCYGDICERLGTYEGIIRIQYGMSAYVVGNVFLDNLEQIVYNCYNYQDSSGNYVFRLYDIDLSKIEQSVVAGEASNGFIWPVDSQGMYISSLYGPRWGRMHKGIDITGGSIAGATVMAAKSGTVVDAKTGCTHNYPKVNSCGCGGGYGNYVLLKHDDGGYTRYAHMTEMVVSVGQRVAQGEKVGTVGNTGHSTGAHLHFEILDSSMAPIDSSEAVPEFIAKYWNS